MSSTSNSRLGGILGLLGRFFGGGGAGFRMKRGVGRRSK